MASSEISHASTVASGKRRDNVTAMQPLPVPMSRISWIEAWTWESYTHLHSSSVSGRGIRHPGRTMKRRSANHALPTTYCTGVNAIRASISAVRVSASVKVSISSQSMSAVVIPYLSVSNIRVTAFASPSGYPLSYSLRHNSLYLIISLFFLQKYEKMGNTQYFILLFLSFSEKNSNFAVMTE